MLSAAQRLREQEKSKADSDNDGAEEPDEEKLRRLMDEDDDEEEEIVFSSDEPVRGFEKLVRTLQVPIDGLLRDAPPSALPSLAPGFQGLDALEWAVEDEVQPGIEQRHEQQQQQKQQQEDSDDEPLQDARELQGPCSYELGGREDVLAVGERALEVLLRPDVLWGSINSCVEAALLAHGLRPTPPAGGLETTKHPLRRSTWMWAPQALGGRSVRVVVCGGVTAQKRRVLLVRLSLDGSATAQLAGVASGALGSVLGALAGALRRSTAMTAAAAGVTNLFTALLAALSEQQLTLSHLCAALDSSVDTLVDTSFVQDLQDMYATEMLTDLRIVAASMDAYVRDMEKTCASVMTCLKPVYEACVLCMPSPPAKKSLNSYPLEFTLQSVSKSSAEAARWVLLRAKRTASQAQLHQAAQAPSLAPHTDHSLRVGALLRAVFQELQSWCEAEARARIQRKTKHTCERVSDVLAYRAQLILTLHARQSHLEQSQSVNSRDAKAWADFRALFRIANPQEPLLLEALCLHEGRQGRLFLTFSHVFFSALTFQRVIPLYACATVRRETNGVILEMALPAPSPSSAERHRFVPVSTVPDMASRLYEIIAQVYSLYHEARGRSLRARSPSDSHLSNGLAHVSPTHAHDLLFDALAAATETEDGNGGSQTEQDDEVKVQSERKVPGETPGESEMEVVAPSADSYVCDEGAVLRQVHAVAAQSFAHGAGSGRKSALANSIDAFLKQAQTQP